MDVLIVIAGGYRIGLEASGISRISTVQEVGPEVPVVDLPRALGEDIPDTAEIVVVVQTEAGEVGLGIQNALQLLPVPQAMLAPLPGVMRKACHSSILGVINDLGGEPLFVVDTNALALAIVSPDVALQT